MWSSNIAASRAIRTRIDKTAYYLHINIIKTYSTYRSRKTTIFKRHFFNAAAIELSSDRFLLLLYALDARKHNFFFTPIDRRETQSNVKDTTKRTTNWFNSILWIFRVYQAIKSHTKRNETLSYCSQYLISAINNANERENPFDNIGCLQELNKVMWNAVNSLRRFTSYWFTSHKTSGAGNIFCFLSLFMVQLLQQHPRFKRTQFESV